MKIEPIGQLPAWRTSDGVLHTSEEAALKHAEDIAALRALSLLADMLGSSPDENDVRKLLLKHHALIEELIAHYRSRRVLK